MGGDPFMPRRERRTVKLSVIIDTYNSGAFVVEAVESVLSQGYRGDVEITVVDDGSTDDTRQRLDAYTSRIGYVRKENGGQLSALNRGFSLATGEVILLLDGDDLWLPGKLARVADAFAADPSLGLVHHKMLFIGKEGELVDREGSPTERPVYTPNPRNAASGDLRRRMRLQGLRYLYAPCSGLAISRKAMEAIRPLPEAYRINADAFVAMPTGLIFPVLYLPEPLGCFRIHGANSSRVHPDYLEASLALGYMKGYYEHANRVLERVEGTGGLVPEAGWGYVKYISAAEARRPVCYVPRMLGAVARSRSLSLGEKVRAVVWVGARAVERSFKRRKV